MRRMKFGLVKLSNVHTFLVTVVNDKGSGLILPNALSCKYSTEYKTCCVILTANIE